MKYNKAHNTGSEGSLLKALSGGAVRKTSVQKEVIRINFTGEGIGDSSEHQEELDAIRSAGSEDVIYIYFTGCPGGVINTGMALMNAIVESPARVVAVLEGSNASLATMIPMVCSEVVVTPYTSMMLHSPHGGDYGTVLNKERSAVFFSQLYQTFLSDIYEGFLTPDEIEDVKNGLEIYLDADAIEERRNRRAEQMSKEVADLVAEMKNVQETAPKKTPKKKSTKK